MTSSIILREGHAMVVESAIADFPMDVFSHSFPAFRIAGEMKHLNVAYHSIHGDPGHDFGMNKVPPRASDFPNSLVRFSPFRFEVLHHIRLDVPSACIRVDSCAAGLMEGIHHLPKDV